jgi:hypothetical protein
VLRGEKCDERLERDVFANTCAERRIIIVLITTTNQRPQSVSLLWQVGVGADGKTPAATTPQRPKKKIMWCCD